LHSVAFGSGGADLFMALLNGVAVLPFDIASEGILNLVQWLKRERITVFHSPPAVFRELENVEISPDDFTDLRLIRLSGAASVNEI
jgi:non-ribosomal peptide synthetase component F